MESAGEMNSAAADDAGLRRTGGGWRTQVSFRGTALAEIEQTDTRRRFIDLRHGIVK